MIRKHYIVQEDVKITYPEVKTKSVPRESIAIYSDKLPRRYQHIKSENLKEPIIVAPYDRSHGSKIRWIAIALPPKTAKMVEVRHVVGISPKHLPTLTFFRAEWHKSGPKNIDSIDVVLKLISRGWKSHEIVAFSGRPKSGIRDLVHVAPTLSSEVKVLMRETPTDYSMVVFKEIGNYPNDRQVDLWNYIHTIGIDHGLMAYFLVALRRHVGINISTGRATPVYPPEIVFPQGDDIEKLIEEAILSRPTTET